MTPARLFMNVFAWTSLAVVIAGLAWILIFPPPSMRLDRDGVAHYTPEVEHPITGEPISMNELIKHYRGD